MEARRRHGAAGHHCQKNHSVREGPKRPADAGQDSLTSHLQVAAVLSAYRQIWRKQQKPPLSVPVCRRLNETGKHCPGPIVRLQLSDLSDSSGVGHHLLKSIAMGTVVHVMGGRQGNLAESRSLLPSPRISGLHSLILHRVKIAWRSVLGGLGGRWHYFS